MNQGISVPACTCPNCKTQLSFDICRQNPFEANPYHRKFGFSYWACPNCDADLTEAIYGKTKKVA